MSIDSHAPTSRRALLIGTIGGLGAIVAQALGRPTPVRAADVVLGGVNATSDTTTIQNTVDEDTVLRVQSVDGLALHGSGWSGALLRGRSRPGVTGAQISGPNLFRVPNVRAGVVGFGEDSGVRGSSVNKVGVLGYAGGDGPSNMPPNAGVYGWSTSEGIGVSYGVLGRSTAPLGYGVFGTSNTGTGLSGTTQQGTAVAATVSPGGTGRALNVSGPVHFSTSGLATIPSANDRVVVSPGVPLNASTKVLATLMGNPGGTVVLKRVAIQDAADTFTIFLSGATANSIKIAWFVMA